MRQIPILIGNTKDKAIINPIDYVEYCKKIKKIKSIRLPKYCILGFYKDMYKFIEKNFKYRKIIYHEDYPIYILKYRDVDVAFVYPTIGSSSAGSVLEELIALGSDYFIFFGGAGTIISGIERGRIIIPHCAIRDEGTSYHYAKPTKYAYPSKLLLKFLRESLRKNKVNFIEGTTWTTDAPYRETIRKAKIFSKMDAIVVEMEASALFAIARYRRKHIAGILMAGDSIAENRWDHRIKTEMLAKIKEERNKLLFYSLDAISLLSKGSKQ